jgi:ionotropic glutamate receptor
MLTIEPVIASVVGAPTNITLLDAAYDIWKQYEPETFPGAGNVNYYALFAFDATWLLIQSLEQLCSTTSGNSSSCISFTGSSFCFDRQFLNSNRFFNIINAMSFLGVSGLVQFNTNVTDRINGSYYLSQNSQNYSNSINFVPVLGYSDYNGWYRYTGMNLIIWPGDTLSIPSDNPQLNGVTLRLGVYPALGYTMVSNVTNQFGQQELTFTGYLPDLINLLQINTGFIPNIELAPSNLSYNQLVQSVADGVYDIVVADVTVTSARTKIVDFSSSIYVNAYVIVMRKNTKITFNMLSFLKPFSLNLWLLIFVSIIVSGIVFCLLERERNEALQGKPIGYVFEMSLWYSFCNMVAHEAGFEARTGAGHLLSVGIYILSLVLVASYTANLAADLTLAKPDYLISGFDDIKNGKLPFNRIGILAGSSIESYYLTEISNGRQNFYPIKNEAEVYDLLLNGTIDATFIDIATAEYATNNIYCNLTIVGNSFWEGTLAIVMPKQWVYEKELDVNVLALGESGDLDKLKLKWISTSNCPVLPETSTPIEIESMGGLFLFAAIICGLSLLLFAWKKRQRAKIHVATLVS